MSTDGQIQSALATRSLHYLDVVQSDPVRRVMLLNTELRDVLADAPPTLAAARRLGRLRADLQMFVKGEIISMCFEPFRHRGAYMGRYNPINDGTWAIRSRDPNPGIRVFGRFAKRDVFVALSYKFRSIQPNWGDKKPLGAADSLEHQFAMIEVDQRWNQLFPETEAIKGENCRDYLSEDVFIV